MTVSPLLSKFLKICHLDRRIAAFCDAQWRDLQLASGGAAATGISKLQVSPLGDGEAVASVEMTGCWRGKKFQR